MDKQVAIKLTKLLSGFLLVAAIILIVDMILGYIFKWYTGIDDSLSSMSYVFGGDVDARNDFRNTLWFLECVSLIIFPLLLILTKRVRAKRGLPFLAISIGLLAYWIVWVDTHYFLSFNYTIHEGPHFFTTFLQASKPDNFDPLFYSNVFYFLKEQFVIIVILLIGFSIDAGLHNRVLGSRDKTA